MGFTFSAQDTKTAYRATQEDSLNMTVEMKSSVVQISTTRKPNVISRYLRLTRKTYESTQENSKSIPIAVDSGTKINIPDVDHIETTDLDNEISSVDTHRAYESTQEHTLDMTIAVDGVHNSTTGMMVSTKEPKLIQQYRRLSVKKKLWVSYCIFNTRVRTESASRAKRAKKSRTKRGP